MPRCAYQAAVRLIDGRVMIISGGSNAYPYVTPTSEIYDPVTGLWTKVAGIPTSGPGTLPNGHTGFAVTLLRDGKVLMAGGYDGYFGNTSAGVFRYDPALNTWQIMTPMAVQRNQFTGTLLPDCRVLLVAGRHALSLSSYTSAEIYDPSALPNGAVSFTPPNPVPRAFHASTLTTSGRVLVTGGFEYVGSSCCTVSTRNAALYDPALNAWLAASPMTDARTTQTSTLLPSGDILASSPAEAGSTPRRAPTNPTRD